MSDLIVVLTEALFALAMTAIAWSLRKRRPAVFLMFPLLGATWFALAHGIVFSSDGSPDPGMLMGFGIVAALFGGLPTGCVAAVLAFLFWGEGENDLQT
jgi:hypothetical protein